MTLSNLEKTFFTDGKIFKLPAPNNKQNDRIFEVNLRDIREKGDSEKRKFPVSLMFSAGVSKLGKTSIHFVTSGARTIAMKFCHNYCQRLSSYQMAMELLQHTSKVKLTYLEENCCKLLKPDF